MVGRFAKQGIYKDLFTRRDFYMCLFGGLLAMASHLLDTLAAGPVALPVLLAAGSVTINGFPIVVGAVKGLLRRSVNVDELVSIAIIASIVQGEWLTAAVVSFIMTLGALVEEAASDSARKSIRELVTIMPRKATLIVEGEERAVPLQRVKTGDRLLVKPGERIPVDGTIVAGGTAVDESTITGESIPRSRREGDTVLAGTLNHTGVIEIEAVRVGEDTTLGKVIALVREAETHKPGLARLVDRYATWFTPLILGVAGLAWWWSGELNRAIAVLIAGCPCALIMAAPTATVAAIGRAARGGVLVKGGRFLEEAARARVVLFDKTGTLTLGEPRVDEIAVGEGFERNEVIACAACVEQNCNHPLANAVLKAAHYAKIRIKRAERVLNEVGLGVRAMVDGATVEVGSAYIADGTGAIPAGLRGCLARIKERGATPLVVYRDRTAIGIIGVKDRVRPAAREAVQDLTSLGIGHISILSGDHEKAVQNVAASLGIETYRYGLKPEEKLDVLKGFQKEGGTVMFVGDGINDAPALATANVGVAMGATGTDVALETADVALTDDDVSKIPFLIRLSRKMVGTVKVNLALALLFNVLAVAGSGAGLLTPILASLVHNAGSVLVVLSSASLALAKNESS